MPIFRVPVTIDWTTAGGGPGKNILHVSTQPGGQPGDLGEAITALASFYDKLKTLYPSSATITVGDGVIEDPLGSPSYADVEPIVVPGMGSAVIGPTLLTLVASWRTSSATRSGRGRTFIGPLVKTVQDTDGTVNGADLTIARDAVTDLVDDSRSANGWALGILSTKDGTFREVLQGVVHDRWGVLRSRRG